VQQGAAGFPSGYGVMLAGCCSNPATRCQGATPARSKGRTDAGRLWRAGQRRRGLDGAAALHLGRRVRKGRPCSTAPNVCFFTGKPAFSWWERYQYPLLNKGAVELAEGGAEENERTKVEGDRRALRLLRQREQRGRGVVCALLDVPARMRGHGLSAATPCISQQSTGAPAPPCLIDATTLARHLATAGMYERQVDSLTLARPPNHRKSETCFLLTCELTSCCTRRCQGHACRPGRRRAGN